MRAKALAVSFASILWLIGCTRSQAPSATPTSSSPVDAGSVIGRTSGEFYAGTSTLMFDAPPPDFGRATESADAFVVATVAAIGEALLNTDSGEFVVASEPIGFVPVTPVDLVIDEVIAERPQSRLTKPLRSGDKVRLLVAGGKIELELSRSIADRMFLFSDKPDESARVINATSVRLSVALDTGIRAIKPGQTVVVGVSTINPEYFDGKGRGRPMPILTIADRTASIFVLEGDVLKPSGDKPERGAPTTLAELRRTVQTLNG